MAIFIGNLPPAATEADLRELARPPAGSHLRIIKKKSRDGEFVRFALLQTTGPKQAHKLIARLNGKRLLGTKLVAREYQPRVAGNEQRRIDWRQLDWPGAERRRDERRSMLSQPEPVLLTAAA
jgi:RNA recognition motif-containing protein